MERANKSLNADGLQLIPLIEKLCCKRRSGACDFRLDVASSRNSETFRDAQRCLSDAKT